MNPLCERLNNKFTILRYRLSKFFKKFRSTDEPEWIINHLGELGVKVKGKCYFLYKGESLQYRSDDLVWARRVGKREFGEVCRPQIPWVNPEKGILEKSPWFVASSKKV